MSKGRRKLAKPSDTAPPADPVFDILDHAGLGLENVRDVFRPPLPGDKIEDIFDWFWASERTDKAKGKDKSELLELLRTAARPFPLTARMCVADLLERYRLIICTQMQGQHGPIAAEEENTEQKAQFIRMLRSVEPTSDATRVELAAMLQSHKLKLRPGKQPTPFYREPNSEWVLKLAGYEVRRMRKAKISIEQALEQVANDRGIKLPTLRNYWEKRRGSTRKIKQEAIRASTEQSKVRT